MPDPASVRGPAVVIISVEGFIRIAAPPPGWLKKASTSAKQRGLDKLVPTEIDAISDGNPDL
ncbi:MAG TPA: hypothetical protein VGR45_08095 [Stellaceae bacterium]|nr:hypothetical protein [Stellaceae bacterium]